MKRSYIREPHCASLHAGYETQCFALASLRLALPMVAAMADVRLKGITKTWGTAAAVENISFSAPAGHLVALLGPVGLRQVDDACG